MATSGITLKVEKILLKDGSKKTREGLFRCDRTKPGALFAGGFLERFAGGLTHEEFKKSPVPVRARFKKQK